MQRPFDRHPPPPYDHGRQQSPPHRFHPQQPHEPPYQKFAEDPMSRDTTKVTELKDRFGVTRFKIALTDYDTPEYPQNDDLQEWDILFQVTVVSYCCKDESTESIILFEEQYEDYTKAVEKFNELVSQYRILINSETKGWQDITSYAEKINFRTIDPDCCKNCIWAKPIPYRQQLFNDWKHHRTRMVCTHPDLAKVEEAFFPRNPTRQPIDPRHPYRDISYVNEGHFYHQERQFFELDMSPYTKDDGICDNYQRGTTNK